MGRYTGKKCRLLSMIALTSSFFVIEITVGYVTNSMALVADSFHMLSDVASIIIAFLSVKMSPKKWSKNTFGWARAEVLGALVNAVFLVALCFSILIESLKRFLEVEEIHDPQLILIVGAIGLGINGIGLLLFHEHGHSHGGGNHGHSHGNGHNHSHLHGHSHLSQLATMDDNENDSDYQSPQQSPSLRSKSHNKEDSKIKSSTQLNMKGVFLHVLADALGSIVVIISALIIWLTDWEYRMYVDPTLSICLVGLIMWTTWPLLQESALILLQTVPTHIQLDDIQRRLVSQVDGVLAVHEFHVWQLAGDRIIASAHIRCRNLSDYMKIAEKVKEFFHNEGIHSTTIQPEFTELPDESTSETESCALDCPSKDRTCAASTCCGPSKQGRDSPQNELLSSAGCRQRTTTAAASAASPTSPSSTTSATAVHLQQEQNDCACGPDGLLSCMEAGAHSALITSPKA